MRIKKLSEDKYKVESEHRKGVFYTVEPDKPFCSCPAFLYRMRPLGQVCKHIDAVRAVVNKQLEQVSKKKTAKHQHILDFVKENGPINSVKLLEMFGEDEVNEMLHEGFLIERNGRISLLE